MNIREEQMKFAILSEISDTPKKNSAIIKGAENNILMDDEFNRLMQDNKTTTGRKRLQFCLYYLKRDNAVSVPQRGVYTENDNTRAERIKTAHNVKERLISDKSIKCILKDEVMKVLEEICKTNPKQVINKENTEEIKIDLFKEQKKDAESENSEQEKIAENGKKAVKGNNTEKQQVEKTNKQKKK